MTDFSHPDDASAGPSQAARKAALAAAIALGIGLLLIGDSRWDESTGLHEGIEWAGLALIVFCILGRTWCSLYIGGRKNRELAMSGPYSVSRNPLYLFSIIGAVGVGAQVGSIALAVIAGIVAWLVFLMTAMREEAALLANFGTAYRDYMARVPRFLPRLANWRDADTLQVRPQIVMTTFVDALFFLIAVPIAEGIEYLHAAGYLPTLLRLP
ncbi:MAG: isoprenylcysteine carboxylmethyltransferase family protein [Pseudolabrys sp.]